MPITKAVASSVKTPGIYLTINLLGPSSNPGTARYRALLIAPKSSIGAIAPDVEVRQCFGPLDAAVAVGPGTLGHLAAKRFFQRFPLGALDIVAPTESAGAAATAVVTFTGPATQDSTIRFYVHGRVIEATWLNGETADTFAARAAAAINQLGEDLFVTASAAVGSITLTAKLKGPVGNDVRIFALIYEGGGGIAISANPLILTGGTTEPSIALALALVGSTQYDAIIPCLSNADAADATSSSNAERLADHINAHETGLGALLQTAFVGLNGTTTQAKAGAIDRNNEAIEYALGRGWDDLPCEIAAAEAGDALFWATTRPNYNRIGNVHNLYGPRDVITHKLSGVETEDLLSNGVTPLDVDTLTGQRFVVRPITTHSAYLGAPDYRAYDFSDTLAMYAVFGGLRSALKQEFPNANVTEDLPAGADELPAGVVEVRDIRAFCINYLRGWVPRGVVSGAKLDAKITAGELSITIDDLDKSQVNITLPTGIIAPLAKLGIVASKVA